MDQTEYHQPVLAEEVVQLLRPVPQGLIVDATFGGGGHTRALLAALPDQRVLALDRDPDAARSVPADPRLRFLVANFADLAAVLSDLEDLPAGRGGRDGSRPAEVAGVVFDLGVSSHQLDDAGRGFSFRRAGPLDMRMGPDTKLTAADVVNSWSGDDIARVLRVYGEERFAGRVAAAIVAARPIADTATLAAVVAAAMPARSRRTKHPARRTFQAIRIAVNGELDALERGLDDALAVVQPGGRVVVIAYHSLEDRIVKRHFATATAGCVCPPDLPVCGCGLTTEFRSLTRKPIRPSEAEISLNPRARSALLRAVERTAPHVVDDEVPGAEDEGDEDEEKAA